METRSTYADAEWSPSQDGNLPFWQSRFAEEFAWVKHVFAPIGFNMSATSGPDTANTTERRARACEAVGSSIDQLTCAKQAHGANITVVQSNKPHGPLCDTDGFVTGDAGVVLMVFTADCPSILVFDPKRRVIGTAHSGWKGTCQNVVGSMLSVMTQEFKTDAADALAVIGPCASSGCYEIREDVASQVRAATADTDSVIRKDGAKIYLDLPKMIAQQLESAGLSQHRIALPSQCTICNEQFYSYRRQGRNAGQGALVVSLTG
ncbi:MAG: peptidoglycan editing factor PgeF [Planctomycetes bacterium]|nr:peptidoglycan editing factor PgeF [Planctomycetota bacterium]